MKFGVCTGVVDVDRIKAAGFDYFECSFAGWTTQSEEEFKLAKKKIEEIQFYPEAMNGMLPGELKVVGENADLKALEDFMKIGFARAAEVGTKVVVFGSGKARSVPAGCARATAYEQIDAFLNLANDCAAPYGINIAIEPLSFKECNILNTVSEAAFVCGRVERPHVRVLADYFHVGQNNENPESIVGFAHRMEHCHIANPITRQIMKFDDGFDYSPFFNALKKAGYDKRVSFEGRGDWGADNFVDQLRECLALMKKYWE